MLNVRRTIRMNIYVYNSNLLVLKFKSYIQQQRLRKLLSERGPLKGYLARARAA